MAITVTDTVIQGQTVKEITYVNRAMRLTLTSVGAAIKRLEVPDRHKTFENIVMTYAHDEDYLNNTKFLGANVGPYAGRIDPPELRMNARTYELDRNFLGRINLHSGSDNLAFKHFELVEADATKAVFTYQSSESVSTFPGPMTCRVTYRFQPDGFTIEYDTHCEKDCVSNLTNHSYFNLSGNLKRDTLEHRLHIPARHYLALNEDYIGTKKTSVDNTPFDFTAPRRLSEGVIPLKGTPQKGIDHPFFLDEGIVKLYDPESGRMLELSTDYDCLVVYTNNILTPHTLEAGHQDKAHYAVCLEAQHLPNDVHFEDDPKSVLSAGKQRKRTLTYRFSTLSKRGRM